MLVAHHKDRELIEALQVTGVQTGIIESASQVSVAVLIEVSLATLVFREAFNINLMKSSQYLFKL